MSTTDTITTSHMTPEGTQKLLELDASFVGTPDYMGIAYFWAHRYRHVLRDVSPARRRAVHAKLIKTGLAPDEESPEHDRIVGYPMDDSKPKRFLIRSKRIRSASPRKDRIKVIDTSKDYGIDIVATCAHMAEALVLVELLNTKGRCPNAI